jgi:hypothetical protein
MNNNVSGEAPQAPVIDNNELWLLIFRRIERFR